MKLQPDRSDSLTITAYSANWIAVNGIRYAHHLLINSKGLIQPWPCKNFSNFEAIHLDLLTPMEAEIILLGCGSKQLFAPPALLGAFIAKGMGLETMDTAAACRTFNILAGEGRHVAAILFLDQPSS